MPMNAPRQPHRALIHGTTSGVSMAPKLVPALKIPVDKARSFLGNHSATALMLAGKKAPSPNPEATREIGKLREEIPSAVPLPTNLHKTISKAQTDRLSQ